MSKTFPPLDPATPEDLELARQADFAARWNQLARVRDEDEEVGS